MYKKKKKIETKQKNSYEKTESLDIWPFLCLLKIEFFFKRSSLMAHLLHMLIVTEHLIKHS